ncbi:MAG TPA: Trp biosynthesis-associated membrane protein [Candidatus Lumbricidophila sp.]|nr:Trp biosynthesis-associated membrane protein [Candidatus Lumbricidophila sp.]
MIRRAKLISILLALVGCAGALATTTAGWFDVQLASQSAALAPVLGTKASPAVPALALAGLVGAAAVSIAGPVVRRVLAVLLMLVGGCLGLAVVTTLTDPIGAVQSAVTAATGVSGAQPVAALVASVTPSAAPYVAAGCAALVLIAGVFALMTAASWSTGGARYRAAEYVAADPQTHPVDAWDALARGADPTVGRAETASDDPIDLAETREKEQE